MKSEVRFFNTYEPVTVLYRSLIPRLAEARTPVTVYVSRAEYRAGRDLDAALAHLSTVHIRKVFNLGLHARHGTLAKALIGITYFLAALLSTLTIPGRHRNVFLTQPPFLPLLGLILSKVRKQPYCVVLMDLQPQLAAAVNVMREGSLTYRLFHLLNSASLRAADRVVVIGRCMKHAVERLGVGEEIVRVIPNWADVTRLRPVEHCENGFRRDMGWHDEFVVMFAGNLGYPQSMDELIAAARSLEGDARVRFVIIGEGVRKRALADRLAELNLKNVELHPFMHERYELAEILSAGDLHFIPLDPAVTALAVPSKTYGILAVGRPFLFQGANECEIARIALEEGVGFVVPPRSPVGIRDTLLRLVESPEQSEEAGRRGRKLTEERWNSHEAVSAYMTVLAELEEDGKFAAVSGCGAGKR